MVFGLSELTNQVGLTGLGRYIFLYQCLDNVHLDGRKEEIPIRQRVVLFSDTDPQV